MFVSPEDYVRQRYAEEARNVEIALVNCVMGLMESIYLFPNGSEYFSFNPWLPPSFVWLVMHRMYRLVEEMRNGNCSVSADENRHSRKRKGHWRDERVKKAKKGIKAHGGKVD